MPDDMKAVAGAIAVALRFSVRCIIIMIMCLYYMLIARRRRHIELQLEGDHNVGQFDKAAG
jgi:hypothetical protein